MLVIATWIGSLNRIVEGSKRGGGAGGRGGSLSVRRYMGQATSNYRYGDDRGTHVIDRHPSLEGDPCQFGGVLSPSGRGVEHLRQRAGKRFHLVTLPRRATNDSRLPCKMGIPMLSQPTPPSPLRSQSYPGRQDGLDRQGTHPHTHPPTHTHKCCVAARYPPLPLGGVLGLGSSQYYDLGKRLDCMAVGCHHRSSSTSLTPILLSPPSPGGSRRGAGKQSSTRPAGRTSAWAARTAHHGWHGKPMPSSWELHLLHVSELCPCAVNLGTAEFLSDRGRWGRWIRRRRMRAQPRPTTAHSTAQYIAYSFLTTTTCAQRRIAAHLPGECRFSSSGSGRA